MHVDERVEAALWAGEKPVDGSLFVAAHMVVVEVLEEISTDVFAQGFFDELEVCLVIFIAKSDMQETLKSLHDFICKPVAIENRNHVILVGMKRDISLGNCSGLIFPFLQFLDVVFNSFTLIRKDKAGHIKRVSSEHTANRIADEFLHCIFKKSRLHCFPLLTPHFTIIDAVAVMRVAG